MENLLGTGHATSVVHPGDDVDGRYHVHAVIAEGGMGTVFLAEHVLIKRRVALKVLHPWLARDVDMVRRFLAEASTAGTLGHPNIVASTDMGFTPEQVPFIVFEYLEGAQLSEEIDRVHGMPVQRALRIAMQIASALDAAHSAGVIHLDLKSDNILLVDQDGHSDHVKVLDFGIAKFLRGDVVITQRDVIVGTPEFMSPEQITAPETVDARADIWALGVVLYEMLTAQRPFSDDTARLLLHRIVHERPTPLPRAGVPEALHRLLFDRMLAKDPADRLSSMREVHEALATLERELRTGSESKVAPAAQPPPPAVRLIRLPPAPASRWPIGLFVLAMLAGLGGGGLLYGEQRMTASLDDATLRGLEADAAQLTEAIAGTARSTGLRATTLAAAPMLRVGIETDAATLADLARDEHLFAPEPREVLQLFQLRDGQPDGVLRLPQDAPPLLAVPPAGHGRVERDRAGLTVIASASIGRSDGAPGGLLALAVPIDLAPLRVRFAGDALQATLVGLGDPIELVPRQAPEVPGVELVIPMTLPADLGAPPMTLRAVVRPITRGKLLRQARYAAWGVGGLLLLGFLAIGSIRARR